MLGRLNADAFKHDWIEYLAGVSIVLGAIAIIALITYLGRWKWLWKEWITSVDHKKIGIMYLVYSFLMLAKGLIDAAMMRAQQAVAVGESMGYLASEHFQQIFTAHGMTMIFFVGMGFMFGLINLLVPLQIGAEMSPFRSLTLSVFGFSLPEGCSSLSHWSSAFIQRPAGWLILLFQGSSIARAWV